MLKELVKLKVSGKLSRQLVHHELSDSPQRIVFGYRRITVLGKQHEYRSGREAAQLFHSVNILKGYRVIVSFLGDRRNGEIIPCRFFHRLGVGGLEEVPLLYAFLYHLVHVCRVKRTVSLLDLKKLKRLDLNTGLLFERKAVVERAVKVHIAVTRHAYLFGKKLSGSDSGAAEGCDLGGTCFHAYYVVNVSEAIAEPFERRAKTGCARLICGSNEPAILIPTAKPPKHHRKLTVMLGDLHDRMGGYPPGNAKHKCVKALLSESLKRLSDLLLLRVVGNRIDLYELNSLALKR